MHCISSSPLGLAHAVLSEKKEPFPAKKVKKIKTQDNERHFHDEQ